MGTSNTKASETSRATALIGGTKKHLAGVTSLTLASAPHTPAEIQTELQHLLDLHVAVDGAQSVAKAKLGALNAEAPAIRALMKALVAYVKLTFSESPDVLADFGLPPKTVTTPLTTAQMAVAVAKREATRKARGTTGKRKKQQVTGNVVGVVLTPVVASPAAPAPVASSVAPSPTATSSGATGGATSHGA
jgi:hypothetical protein